MTKLSEIRPKREGFNRLLCPPEEPFDSERCARRAAGMLYSRARCSFDRESSPEWVFLVFVHDDDAIVQVDLPKREIPGMMAMRLGSQLSTFGPECFAYAQKVGRGTIQVAAQMFDRRTWVATMCADDFVFPTREADANLFESFWEGVREEELSATDEE